MLYRYLDPKNDYSFQKIFGDKAHASITMDFLNAVLDLTDPHLIVDLEVLRLKEPPHIAARRESLIDLLVRDQQGVQYIIEMQVATMENFEKRAQYYAAHAYCAYFEKGKKYQDIKKVIFLSLTEYIVFPDKKEYKSKQVTLDNTGYTEDLTNFSFAYVELPKFNKTLDQLSSIEEKWYYFF